MDESHKWFLMKHDDGSIFGPMDMYHLRQWAADAYVSPLDKVSTDQHSWMKAPMIPDLQMDFLLEINSDYFYGPTTVGAVREFLASGEITEETRVTNCRTGEIKPLCEFPFFAKPEGDQNTVTLPGAKEHLQNRIRELEEKLLEERRLRQVAEEMRTRAEARILELERLLT